MDIETMVVIVKRYKSEWLDPANFSDVPNDIHDFDAMQLKATKHNLKYYLLLILVFFIAGITRLLPGAVLALLAWISGFLLISKPAVKYTAKRMASNEKQDKD